ncbi:aminodeoxychorismate lyase [Marinicella litoralis]|uniref:Aminodeoxychorismate lyase n=1 Tax=Marinicella litoralis TaxID=644220 RepID=A0A4R6XGT3_9GAMM|nr:aminodeoxychorismate lyase [Marinicella litoralis]TDR16303.1 4-amino-4-deoxychorismate lyase [Marinicella litoralis]
MIVAASFDVNEPENWNNRALQYGDGVFETMRCMGGELPLWSLHKRRLKQGLQRLNLKQPDLNAIYSLIRQQCISRSYSDCVVKLVVFRTFQGRSYQAKINDVEWYVTTNKWEQQTKKLHYVLAVAKARLSKQPALAGIKHLNRLEQVLIANELNQLPGVDDLLVLDQANRIVETTHQNIVLIKGSQLFTPKLKHCGVKGVALKWLKNNFDVNVKAIDFTQVSDFDALMVGNSIRGFRLVAEVIAVDSFVTSHPVHDKITRLWGQMFNQ